MHRRHRRVPGGPGRLDPAEDLQRVEPRRAPDRSAGGKARRYRRHQPVDVEKRHHVEATVVRREREAAGDMVRGCREVAMAKRHDLGPRGRARRMQDQGQVARPRGGALGLARGHALGAQGEAACGIGRVMSEAQDRKAQMVRGHQSRAVIAFGQHDGLGAEVREVEFELFEPVGRIEGRGDGALGKGHEGRGHLGSVRQNDGHPVALSHARGMERRDRMAHKLAQARIGQPGPVGGADGEAVIAVEGEKVRQGRGHGLFLRRSRRRGLPPEAPLARRGPETSRAAFAAGSREHPRRGAARSDHPRRAASRDRRCWPPSRLRAAPRRPRKACPSGSRRPRPARNGATGRRSFPAPSRSSG